ncbi:MAG: penicillin acylase family protein [Herpetosiphonaceae bacterium]|nr:penicillin acylase family protein [Herpetosiphonaceae bacterium]
MRLLIRLLRWLLIVILLGVVVVGAGGYFWLRGSLPQTDGTITVQGLQAPVEIVRDVDAVPHIRAGNEADALFGLGYVHAQDRLWQMEFQRRVGYGRLSEVLGAATLDTDKFLRTLGTGRAAESAWSHTAPAARTSIEAYVSGVNAFISTHHGRALPIEFTILGFAPQPWQPQDILVWGKMMSWNLGANWETELLRTELIAKVGADRTAQLLPVYTADGPVILPHGVAGVPLRTAIAEAPRTVAPVATEQLDQLLAINDTLIDNVGLGGSGIGSNNWVIAGSHTTTGKPLLANDPHLGTQAPSIWYLAHITGGAMDAIGATLPGVPGIIIGHNQHIAWGVTNTGPDVQDLYREHINDRNQVEHNGTMEPLQLIQDTIKVKGQPAVPITIRISRHGPIISDATTTTGVAEPLAFRWTALDPEDHTISAYLGIDTASNWQQFTTALQSYLAPMQNFVYADVDGNIGYYAPGALPIRKSGDGTLPAAGWTDAFDWTGYVPFAQLPHSYNPPEGFIATANNKVVPDSYPYLITTGYSAPYRAMRIIELIQSKPKLSPDDVAAMQADVLSAYDRMVLPLLLQAKPVDERSRTALALLHNWDGTVRGDSAAAAIFVAWNQQIAPHIFADELGPSLWKEYRGRNEEVAMRLPQILQGTGGNWCDDVTTPQVEDCPTTLGRALADGLAQMTTAQATSDLKSWRWDRVHLVRFPHNPFDNVAALRPFFSRSIANGGDDFTIDVGTHRRSAPYKQYISPSYRQILDLGNLPASRFIQTLGQSGSPLSSDYANFMQRWQQVQYLPMRYTSAAIDAAAPHHLTLHP